MSAGTLQSQHIEKQENISNGSYLCKSLTNPEEPRKISTGKQKLFKGWCLHSRSMHFSRILAALTCMQAVKEVPIIDYCRKKLIHVCNCLLSIDSMYSNLF